AERLLADRPAVVAAIPFGPPAVQDRRVDAAADGAFLAAGAARLLGPPRRVQPHVAPLHEHARDLHVVVLDEDDLAAELALGEQDELADEVLPRAVGGMRLAREDELH